MIVKSPLTGNNNTAIGNWAGRNHTDNSGANVLDTSVGSIFIGAGAHAKQNNSVISSDFPNRPPDVPELSSRCPADVPQNVPRDVPPWDKPRDKQIQRVGLQHLPFGNGCTRSDTDTVAKTWPL